MAEEFLGFPGSESARRINFDRAQVVPGIVPDTFFLIVRGKAPCLNMKVRLSPRIYVTCPDFWGIEVIGSTDGPFCLTAVKPYVEAILLTGIIGSKGIEVIGATKTKRFKLPGGCRSAFSFTTGKVEAAPAPAARAKGRKA